MKKPFALLIISLAVTGLTGQPSVALAGGFRHHPHGGSTVVLVVPATPFVHHVFPCCLFPHPVGPVVRPFFFPRHFVPVVVYPSPTVVYASPPVVYVQPPPVAVAPPPPMPTVVQYPTGRYELRGDGVTIPYTWVWIPNPPPPPPAPPEAPPAPPQGRAPDRPDTAPSAELALRVPSELYHWVDDRGVAYWTDRLDKVPERYRSNARSPKPPA